MELFLKCCGAVLIAVILILLIGKDRKDLGLALSIGICCMVTLSALQFLRPILDFVRQMESVGKLDHSAITIVLKAMAIGILGEITCLICSDSGNSSMGKAQQFLSSAVMLWLSLPLFTMLFELLQRILGEV